MSVMQFSDLPQEVLKRCLRFSSSATKFKMSSTNRYFSTLVQHQQCWDGVTEMPLDVIRYVCCLEKRKFEIIEAEGYFEEFENNRIIVAILLKRFPMMYSALKADLREDEVFIRQAIYDNKMLLSYLPEKYRNDPSILDHNPRALTNLSYDLRLNKLCVLRAVKNDGDVLLLAPTFWDDFDVVYAAVAQSGDAIMWASKRLLNDKRIVMKAASSSKPLLFDYLSELRSTMDDELAYQAICNWGGALQYLRHEHQINERFALRAVSTYGSSIQYVHVSLYENSKIVHAALNADGASIRFMSDDIRNNETLATMAVKQNPCAFRHVSTRLQANYALAKLAVAKSGCLLSHTCLKLREEKSIVMPAIMSDGLAMEYASKNLRDEEDLAYLALQNKPDSFQFFSRRLQDDDDLVYIAVQLHGKNLQYASKRLQDDPQLFQIALSNGLHLSGMQRKTLTVEMRAILREHKKIRRGFCCYERLRSGKKLRLI